MSFAAITTLPKTTHNTSTLNTGETLSNYSVKLSLSPQKSSRGTFLDSVTVNLFKIPDVNQRLKRTHTATAFQTIFYEVFGLARNQHEFSPCLIDFNPRTYFVRPDLLMPTTKPAISNLSVSNPGSVFHPSPGGGGTP